MATVFTFGTTYIDVSGNQFTGTSIGTGNTLTRIYFASSTFTLDEHKCYWYV